MKNKTKKRKHCAKGTNTSNHKKNKKTEDAPYIAIGVIIGYSPPDK
jgi:hypothetical protein